MPHLYILECVDGSYYTGSTTDLRRRLKQHQEGCGAKHTAKRLPVKLVYYEFFERVEDAFYREKQVQGWSRKKKEALMASDTNLLHELAECQNDTHFQLLASTSLSQQLAQDNALSQQLAQGNALSQQLAQGNALGQCLEEGEEDAAL
jgi:putative endonuclease